MRDVTDADSAFLRLMLLRCSFAGYQVKCERKLCVVQR